MLQINQRQYAETFYNNLLGLGITTGNVRTAVIATINELVEPTSPLQFLEKNKTTLKNSNYKHTLFNIKKNHAALTPGAISISFIGEDHSLSADKDRAEELLNNITIDDDHFLLAFERGLTYSTSNMPVLTVREENITRAFNNNFGLDLNAEQRSLVMAGYITACLASGDQQTKDKVLIFFGENHHDILEHIEYFAKNLQGQALLGRLRGQLLIRSQNSFGFTPYKFS